MLNYLFDHVDEPVASVWGYTSVPQTDPARRAWVFDDGGVEGDDFLDDEEDDDFEDDDFEEEDDDLFDDDEDDDDDLLDDDE